MKGRRAWIHVYIYIYIHINRNHDLYLCNACSRNRCLVGSTCGQYMIPCETQSRIKSCDIRCKACTVFASRSFDFSKHVLPHLSRFVSGCTPNFFCAFSCQCIRQTLPTLRRACRFVLFLTFTIQTLAMLLKQNLQTMVARAQHLKSKSNVASSNRCWLRL